MLRAKNNPAMDDDITTRTLLRALLDGQRQLALQMAELQATLSTIAGKQVEAGTKSPQRQTDSRPALMPSPSIES
jgi:hypothetical protein